MQNYQTLQNPEASQASEEAARAELCRSCRILSTQLNEARCDHYFMKAKSGPANPRQKKINFLLASNKNENNKWLFYLMFFNVLLVFWVRMSSNMNSPVQHTHWPVNEISKDGVPSIDSGLLPGDNDIIFVGIYTLHIQWCTRGSRDFSISICEDGEIRLQMWTTVLSQLLIFKDQIVFLLASKKYLLLYCQCFSTLWAFLCNIYKCLIFYSIL